MRKLAVGVWVVCLIVAGAVPAFADERRPETHGAHCAYRLVPIERSEAMVRARAVRVGCFSTLARALRHGSGGALRPPAGLRPTELTDSLLERITHPTRRGSMLIGTEFKSTGFGGASVDYFAPNACQGTSWEVTNLPTGQDDEFESGKGFGGCDTNKKFAGPWLGGDSITCTPNCSAYGSLNDNVSSLRWRP